jgi:hypothetical protein
MLPEASASAISCTFAHRQVRPFAPGKARGNGFDYNVAYITDAVTVTWAHRNRLMQTVYLVAQGEPSIGPEPGTSSHRSLPITCSSVPTAGTGTLTGTRKSTAINFSPSI